MVVESAEKLPKAEPIEFSLTADQWTYIQAKLPKGFSLQESKKVQKREKKEPSTKLLEVEVSAHLYRRRLVQSRTAAKRIWKMPMVTRPKGTAKRKLTAFWKLNPLGQNQSTCCPPKGCLIRR